MYHGFMVFQACYWTIKNAKSVGSILTKLDQFAMLIAAIGHDTGHDGVNNGFHVNSYSDLAYRYNDQSPLENLHAQKVFEALKMEDCNVFEGLDKVKFQEARTTVVSAILHTDMSTHQQTLDMLVQREGFGGVQQQAAAVPLTLSYL